MQRHRCKDCRRKHWELGIAESVGAWMEGNQLGIWKKGRFAGRESSQTVGATPVGDSLWNWRNAVQVGDTATASPTSVSHWIKWECWNILAALHRRLICKWLGTARSL